VTPPVPRRSALERAFLQSVVYAALFNYPLTLSQLREALIGERASEAELSSCYSGSPRLQAAIDYADGY